MGKANDHEIDFLIFFEGNSKGRVPNISGIMAASTKKYTDFLRDKLED